MAKMKNTDNTKCRWVCRETGSLIHCWWDVKWYSYSGKHFGNFFKKTKHATTIWLSNCISGHLSQSNENLCSHKNVYKNIYSQILETNIHVSFNGWMVKHCVAHSYHEINSAMKRNTLLIHATTWIDLKALCWMKKGNLKWLHNGWFHVYKMFEMRKFERKKRLVVAKG